MLPMINRNKPNVNISILFFPPCFKWCMPDKNNVMLFVLEAVVPTPFPSYVCIEMTGEVHICSLQVVVGVQIEAMIYDMCCKQSPCISQGPVTAPAQAVKGSVIHSLILHLGHTPAKPGFTYNRLLYQENNRSTIHLVLLTIAVSLFYCFLQNI